MFFINPYNFVPLADKAPSHTENSEGDYTGYIEYDLYTKTPLFIPNTSNSDTFGMQKRVADHKSFEFFSYQDLTGKTLKTTSQGPENPVIPGSEIRGMFRSNYEILTNSCLSMVDEDKDVVLAKRTNEVFQAGLIKKLSDGTYSLYAAKDCLLRTKGENNLTDKIPYDPVNDVKIKSYIQDSLPEGTKVCFQERKRTKTIQKAYGERKISIKSLALRVRKYVSEDEKKGDNIGYLIKGEPGPKMEQEEEGRNRGNKKSNNAGNEKHCGHVFMESRKIEDNVSLSVLEKALEEYNAISQRYGEYYREFEKFKEGAAEEFFPVYYSKVEDSKHTYLSPASITREIYEKKMIALLGKYAPCNDKNNLCPSCSLFGTVGKDKKGKMFNNASRVRFTDLHLKEGYDAKYEKVVTLKELSSPKLSNTEFYLKRPNENAIFWTYDYYVDAQGKVHLWDAEINGRKFYWHRGEADLPTNVEVTARNTTVRPLKKNVLFSGKVYFDHVTKTELDRLIYLVNTGEQLNKEDAKAVEKKTHGYKLGSGKPLGLGSIATSVRDIRIREIARDGDQIEWKNKSYDDYDVNNIDISEDIKEAFVKLTSYDAIKNTNDIQYPATGEKDEKGNLLIYPWFVSNHKKYKLYGTKGVMDSKMPTKRSEMAFEKYMIPLEEKLGKTISGPDDREADCQDAENGLSGIIKKYVRDKKYGFIVVDGVESDIKFQLSSFKADDRNKVAEKCKVIVEYESYIDKNYELKYRAVKCKLC